MASLDKIAIEGYKIIKKIGQGGMASVYLAINKTKKPQKVAIKILDTNLSEDSSCIKRFNREACICSRLVHPNIVKVYSYGTKNGFHYMIMEYMDGRDLGYYIKNKKKFTIKEIIFILLIVCKSLKLAHESRIIHRDIKPQNILITKKNTIKITDFGIAKVSKLSNLTSKGEKVIGTTFYMSPEQIRGENVDVRTDVYSLGIVAYELLTGVKPYDSDTPWQVIKGHLYKTPLPLKEKRRDVPDYLVSIINKCIYKKRKDRFDNIKLLMDAIRNRKVPKTLVKHKVYLVLESENKTIPLQYDEVFIGRKGLNHIVVEDMYTSRRHARINFENSEYILEDLDSRNGTYVNDKKISSCVLQNEDIIKIGKSYFKFKEAI